MINCNYKCCITQSKFDDIHHLYSFKKIVEETFSNVNLDVRKKVLDYTEEEFSIICKELRRLHNHYGLGVCLTKKIHRLFHKEYGYTNNTKEQFFDFKEKLYNGTFDTYLKEHDLRLLPL